MSTSINLIQTELQHSNLFNYLPKFDEIFYSGQPLEHVLKFNVSREGQGCTLLAVHIIRRDEDFLWGSVKDLVDRAVKQAASMALGVYTFDLLTFDFHKENASFTHHEFAQVLANAAFRLKPGEQALIKYSSAYGLLQKISEAHWGKMILKTSVEVFGDKPNFMFTLAGRILKTVECSHDPVMVLINDLSTYPLYDGGNEQQQGFLDDLIAKQKKMAIEFPPEVYVQDKNGVRELLSRTVVR